MKKQIIERRMTPALCKILRQIINSKKQRHYVINGGKIPDKCLNQ